METKGEAAQKNFEPYRLLQRNLSSITNVQTHQQIRTERGPRVSEPPTQTAPLPSSAASRPAHWGTGLLPSLLPLPWSRRRAGEERRMGRGRFAQSRSLGSPILHPSSFPASCSPSKAAICLPCPGTAGSVPLCQRTVRSAPRQNKPNHINSTWWIKKKNKRGKAGQGVADGWGQILHPILSCSARKQLHSAVYHTAPSFFPFI